jgi:lysophospholipase L1-like esterase
MAAAITVGFAAVFLMAMAKESGAFAPEPWSDTLAAYEAGDRQRPPAKGGIVFIGSSSIGLWNGLEGDFPHLNIIRRGVGGSTLAECARLVDRLVLPYAPRQLVVYAGDNDLATGATPDELLARYLDLVGRVRAALPSTRIAFISIKASPQRAALQPLMDRANALVAAAVEGQPQLEYIDVYHAMLDANGRPDAALFLGDGLHPNAAGYAIWTEAVAKHLN